MATSFNQPFRFLDLPPELRNMVYANLQVVTRHYTIEPYGMSIIHPRPTATLVYKSLPVSIFAVCWQVGSEAYSLLKPKLEYLANEPMRLIVQGEALPFMLEVALKELVGYHEEQLEYLTGFPGHEWFSHANLARKIKHTIPHISFNDMIALGRFVVKFILCKRTRLPKSAVVAVTPPYPSLNTFRTWGMVEYMNKIPRPIVLMPHGDLSEEEQRRFHDTGYRYFPNAFGFYRNVFIEDVGDIEWKEHWEKTGDA